MKIAFAIDFLLERTPEVFLLELMLAGFPEAEIYCLAHAPGNILGRIETHRIHSSPLSRLVKNGEELPGRAWLLPSMARQLQVAPDVDKLIILSSGWAHLIQSHGRTERFVWLHDFAPPRLRLKGWKALFNFHHADVKRRTLVRESHVAFANHALASELGMPAGKVIYPGYKTDDYPMVPDEQHTGEYPYHLVLLNGAPHALVKDVLAAARKHGVAVKCLGDDQAYQQEKCDGGAVEFLGDHCAATTAGMTHAARAVWAMASRTFPTEALGALACGRPAVVVDSAANREVLPGEAVWFLQSPLEETFRLVERDFLSPDKKVLRRLGLKYNERLFKNQLRAWAGVRPQKAED